MQKLVRSGFPAFAQLAEWREHKASYAYVLFSSSLGVQEKKRVHTEPFFHVFVPAALVGARNNKNSLSILFALPCFYRGVENWKVHVLTPSEQKIIAETFKLNLFFILRAKILPDSRQ